ncbi:Swt1 family HEPN domain-containing protein [Thermus thermophilus]|uniref:Putative ATPase (AAA+ superfamily) n=1 Tax=Thermus thermophilus JL-18 TaxID=798128 RepID=H9ZVC1_THETH|nr:Swt1 family HEPN domain-containing protein [Thermus thermophilus]AFH40281.1 putative ATPase (AAA+ superfamily) [Thermus thermophilus JL-18]
MALSNREIVGKGLDLLRSGLRPFVEREYRRVYGEEWVREAGEVLKGDRASLQDPDAQALLKLMDYRWNEVFDEKLGRWGRTLVKELLEFRNRWAHQGAFSFEDAHRALDSMTRLLEMIAAEEAQETARMARELLRRRFEEEAKREAERAVKQSLAVVPQGLKPWREVVTPHPDVASGRYSEAEFAADLAQVHRGEAGEEYGNPLEFYRRTHLTSGLKRLLLNALKRLAGEGGDPVVELQTAFGGGKTHSMLALYHLFGGAVDPGEVPGLEDLLAQAGVARVPLARRAVFVGTAYSPARSHPKPEGVVVRTLWGELAYQLGGVEGYRMVEEEDRTGVAPGSDVLKELFDRFSPALVLIDEWVAFLRNLYGEEGLPAGTFDQNLTFAQALTEAAKRSPRALVVASLPASDAEVGGGGGREALLRLQNVFGRLESVWQPATQDETYEIVRRRLFQPLSAEGYRVRDAVVREYVRYYREHRGEFPSEVLEPRYEERMRLAYPIHPELFDRLYEDWATLEGFQRTRGVLRLLASVVYTLWVRGDTSPLILPGGLPLDADGPRYELVRHLSRHQEGFDQVIDSDIDGPNAKAFALEKERPSLGRHQAARRAARAVFLATAPAGAAPTGKPRGVEGVRVKLGVAHPGESPALFTEALKALSERLVYFHAEGDRYWFETRPSLNRMAQDRAAAVSREEALMELEERLRAWAKGRPALFQGVHAAPAGSGEVADEPSLRLVVLSPRTPYAKGGSEAERWAREVLEGRGRAPRRYRNTLLFLAPEAVLVPDLEEAARQYLAWRSIWEDRESLNLGAADVRQVESRLRQAEDTLRLRLEEAYRHLLVFHQPDPKAPDLEVDALRLLGSGNPLERAASKAQNEGLVLVRWHPEFLGETLARYGFWEVAEPEGVLPLRRLWEDLASYLYLPRLKDEGVLLATVAQGVKEGRFGYAERLEGGVPKGVVLGEEVAPSLGGYLLKPEVAARFLKEKTGEDVPPPPDGEGDDEKVPVPPPPRPSRPRRFYLKKTLRMESLLPEVRALAEEVLLHLYKEGGVRLEVVLEAHAEAPEGFPEDLERVLRENSRVLGAEAFFEED